MINTTIKYSGKNKDKEDFSGEVVSQMPETINEAVDKWGDKVCLSKILQSVTINIQSICRAAEGDDAKAQAAVDTFVPGITQTRTASGVSMKVLKEKLGDLSKEDLDALIAQVEGQATAGAPA